MTRDPFGQSIRRVERDARAGFIKVLDQMAPKAGNPQPSAELPFTEFVRSAGQSPESSE
jgi:hypothetical protein